MVAVRRNRGSGVVIALVIFVVLTFVAIGAAIWFLQNASAATQALNENQEAFAERVGQFFQDQGWEIETQQPSEPYNVRYGAGAYDDVTAKLQQVTNYEKMTQMTGWDSPQAVEEALRVSALQRDSSAQYETASGLLGAYEQKYSDQKQAISSLESEVNSLNKQLATKTESFDESLGELRSQINEMESSFQKRVAQKKDQYENVLARFESQRKDTRKWKDRHDELKSERDRLEKQLAQMDENIAELRQKLREGEKETPQLTAAGEILQVAPSFEFVVLEGGKDVQRERNQKFVIYTETPAGERTRKGTVVVTGINQHTASATVLNKQGALSEGDLFVETEMWQRFEGTGSGEEDS